MTSGDIITWVLFVIIMAAFAVGVRHIVRNFMSGESDCCKGGSSPFCAGCAKEETTARERENAAKAWAAIRAEAREKRGASQRGESLGGDPRGSQGETRRLSALRSPPDGERALSRVPGKE